MSTRSLMLQKDLERHLAARQAITNARKLLHGWETMARMISRNPRLQVKLTAGSTSCTDGHTLWIRVPADLSEELVHDPDLCKKRDEFHQPLCRACDVVEEVNIHVIHEVSHVIFDTFEDVTDYEKAQLLSMAIATEADGKPDSKRAATIKKIIETAPPEKKNDYLNLSDLVSPYLPFIINCCEDIRVNTLMQQERPGTRKMFDAQLGKIFRQGTKQYDGSFMEWKDAPPNAQAAIGVYCKMGGFNWREALAPEIVERLDDPGLDEICDRMNAAKSVREVYRLAFPMLEKLRELGFMKAPDEPEDEPETPSMEQEPEEGNEEEESQTGDPGGDSEESDDGTESESSETSDDPEAGDSSEASGTDDENEASDEGERRSSDSGDPDGAGSRDHQDDAEEESESGDQSPEDSDADGGIEEDSSPDTEGGSSGDEHDDSGDQGDQSSPEGSTSPESVDGSDDTDEGPPQSSDTGQAGAPSPPEEGPVSTPPNMPETADNADKDNGEDGTESPEPYTDEDQERDGTPEEVEHLFKVFGQHEKSVSSPSEAIEETLSRETMEIALEQVDYFDAPSLNVEGVNVVRYDDDEEHTVFGFRTREVSTTDVHVPEPIITGSLTRLRLVFQDNMRGRKQTDLRHGKVNGRALARRVPIGDDRIFKKTTQPGRKDYFVIIGIDCSGSTSYPYEESSRAPRLDLMKAAVMAKAEMLNRLGIPFALYAHSGTRHKVEIFEIKSDREPWGRKQKEALSRLQPYSANLDGHTLEFYRKIAERRSETDRLILYYTDGAMPAANRDEELVILQREIKLCERLGIHLVGIGVNSDSPKEHGLDTILLDSMDDVKLVVKGLQERLAV